MRLALFSSKAKGGEPNLVAAQHPRLDSIPTVLVCPLKQGIRPVPFRPEVEWNGRDYVVMCELTRPINRRALRYLGELGSEDSAKVIVVLHSLLAAED